MKYLQMIVSFLKYTKLNYISTNTNIIKRAQYYMMFNMLNKVNLVSVTALCIRY